MREFGKSSKHSNKLKNRVMWLLTTSIVWQKNAWTLLEWNRFKQTTVVAQLRRICFCESPAWTGLPLFSFKTIDSRSELEIERTVERITPQWRSGTFSWCPSWLAWTAWSQKQTHLSRPLKAHQRGKLLFMWLCCWTNVFYKKSN